MKKIGFLSLVLAAGVFTFNSCKKKEVDNDTQTGLDYTYTKIGYSNIVPMTNNITVNEEGLDKTTTYTCATVTRISGDTTNWPSNGDTLIYEANYGTLGCVDHDGRFKQGKLLFHFYNDFHLQGSKVKVVPDNYYVDGMKFGGIMVIENLGNNSFSRTITNGMCEGSNWNIQYGGTTTVTWLNGFSTPADPSDDIYHFTENSNGVNRNGRGFTVTTTSPVYKNSNCKWISSGVIQLTPEGLATRTLDFGNGTCDNRATMTINGKVFEFNMQ